MKTSFQTPMSCGTKTSSTKRTFLHITFSHAEKRAYRFSCSIFGEFITLSLSVSFPRFHQFLYSILILLTLITVCYVVCLALDLDFNFFLIKIQSVVLGKGIHFLLHRIGWGGLLVAGLLFLGDSGSWCSFMAPSGGEVTPYSGPSGPSSSPSWTEEGENDLLRAVAPFLRRGEHSIPVPDQTPQASASPVDESINASSSSDDSSSSSSYEVSVSEDESGVEVSSEVADSTPQFWGKWEEREQDLFLRAQSLKFREEIDEEYINDIPRNLNEVATLGERAYQSHLEFQEFEVEMVEKRIELRYRFIDLFSNDNDPQVLVYRREHPDPTSRLEGDFRVFYEGIAGFMDKGNHSDPVFREMARDFVDSLINELKNESINSIAYLEFKAIVLNK